MRQQKQIPIQEVLSILELPPNSWKLNPNIHPKEAELILTDFKKLIKKQHHVLVKKFHPDLPKNGEKEEKKMKQINSAVDLMMQLKITVQRRPQPIQAQNVRFYSFGGFRSFSGASDGTSNSTNSTTFTFRYR